jgi:hypothetical protein
MTYPHRSRPRTPGLEPRYGPPGDEEPPKLNDWPEHPVFPTNGSHGAFVVGAVCEEPGCAFDVLVSNGQLDLWRLLHVLHPLAIYVRCTDVKPVAIQNEPDRNFVRLAGFASVMVSLVVCFPATCLSRASSVDAISSRLQPST